MLALRATTRAGDVVAVESPVYFGVLQALEALNLQALELPTHPRNGIDLESLEATVRSGGIQACILSPTYQNPLGFCMTDPEKQRIVDLLARYGIVLIEDDVFGALGLESPRPRPAKAFDTAGNIIFCSSFSKTISPGIRLGWLVPGRFKDEILRQKFLMNISSPVISQLAMAEFLKGNLYRRVTQSAARKYAQRLQTMRDAVLDSFPDATTCSVPVGGFFLWVEMPGDCDTMTLYRLALDNDITFSPGRLFTRANGYQSSLRLNAAAIGSEGIQDAVTRLGSLAKSIQR
jgi:DNA-binding transcriptional MocR family regulator